MKTKTFAIALVVAATAALPAFACGGAKKGMQQSSISTPDTQTPVQSTVVRTPS